MTIASVTCTFNGVSKQGNGCVITDISRPLLTDMVLSTEDVPGRDGAVFLGQRRGPFDISVSFAVWASTTAALLSKARDMSEWLAVDEPKVLSFSDQSVSYQAIPQGVTDFEQLDAKTGRFTVTFHVPDGYAWGAASSVTGTASSPATFTLDGSVNYPVKISMSVANGSTHTFADSYGNYATVVAPRAGSLVIDGEAGRVTIADVPVLMSLGSDFLIAKPGSNTIVEQAGTGTFRVAYRARW